MRKIVDCKVDDTSNRTSLESKLSIAIVYLLKDFTSNRTSLESKLSLQSSLNYNHSVPSNRTSLESKRESGAAIGSGASNLLIAPVWNRNTFFVVFQCVSVYF